MIDESTMGECLSGSKSGIFPPRIVSGHSGRRRWWQVGGDRVELDRVATGWTTHIRRKDWGGVPLEVDGHFGDEAEAIAWCVKMSQILARDHEDDFMTESV